MHGSVHGCMGWFMGGGGEWIMLWVFSVSYYLDWGWEWEDPRPGHWEDPGLVVVVVVVVR